MLSIFYLAALLGAAPGNGVVDGRFLLRTPEGQVSNAVVRRATHGAPASIALRAGTRVYIGELARDGAFSIEAPAGRYLIEYLKLGDQAEFFTPYAVTVDPGEHACVGTFALTLANAEDLGANSGSSLQVTEGCANRSLPSRMATPVPAVTSTPNSALDYLIAFRGGYDWSEDSWLRASFVIPITGFSDRGVLFGASAATTVKATTSISEASAGLGYRVEFFEILAGGGYANKAKDGTSGGALGFASVRLGNELFGLGGRVELVPGGSRLALSVDLSPIALLGSLL